MNEVRVGVIGLGYWGPVLARNFATNPRTRLTAIADLDTKKLDQATQSFKDVPVFTDFRDILPLCDAVAIATPVSTHAPIALECLSANKHLFLEKPMTKTSAESLLLLDEAKKRGLLIAVDHLLIFNGVVRLVKDIIESGELGEILYYNSRRANLGLFQPDVDVLWDLGPHEFSQMLYLLGEPDGRIDPVGASHYPAGHVDDLFVHFTYGNGMIASSYMSWLSPTRERTTVIGGTKKMIAFSDLWVGEEVRIYDRGVDSRRTENGFAYNYRRGGIVIPETPRYEPVRKEIDEFAAAILDGSPLTSDGSMGLQIVKILENCRSKLYNGRE